MCFRCFPKAIFYLPLVFLVFIGFVSKTKTMHEVLGFKCNFPNYFAFTLGP